jgi:surface antigen Omp85-like protein
MRLLRSWVLGITSVVLVSRAAAQTSSSRDTIEAAGPHYRAGGLHEFFLGREYRDLWTTPISVPLLDLENFAGGLRPVSRGGGQQTKSLLLAGQDGREFFFRSVDKDPSATLPQELRGTVAGRVVRDQTSSAFPTAPLVVDRLLSSAHILHGLPRLYVLPPSRRLGEFQADFGGLMGFLEERVGGSKAPAAHWGGATEIIGTDSLFARTLRGADDRVDARALLKARLFDVLIGDWDRHSDQWVWARFGDSLPRQWVPIPRDRDQAFVKYDGLLLGLARTSAPQLTNFGQQYPYIPGATWNGRDLDRRFLVELEWPEWQRVVSNLQAELTDSAIENAVQALPAEHQQIQGKTLITALRSRRDRLPEAAERYYRMLAEDLDLQATDGADVAQVIRGRDGLVDITLAPMKAGSPRSPVYYHRRIDPRVTKEVRLYLGAGDDSVKLAGPGTGGPVVRILGEEGQDVLIDSTRSGKKKFYDDPSGPAKTQGFAHSVDRRPYLAPSRSAEELPPRDWGKRWIPTTWASYGPDIGLFVGGGRTLTVYGFRKNPYAGRHRFRAGFATGPKTYRIDYRGDFRRANSRSHYELLVRASGVDVISFHGFGNEIPAPGGNEFYRVTQDAFGLQPSVVFSLGPKADLQIGPVLKYASTDRHPDRFLALLGDLYGTGNFGELGATLNLRHDSRDQATAARRGLYFDLGGSVYPALWDVDSTFGEVHAEARTYLSVKTALAPTLALRAGAKKLWGQYPFFESAFIGGASTVRLGRVNRYAGDASAYGSAELRLALARFELILPAQLGVFGLADAGRVFLEGESSDTWHSAFGGGLSLSYLQRAYTFSVAVAKGDERTAVYVQAGYGF